MVRDVDKIDALPDGKLKQQDQEYLEKHSLDKLFGGILEKLVVDKPSDPAQFIIDSLQFGESFAKQDPETGLSEYRKNKLLDVFRVIDREATGKISLRALQAYAGKHGGRTLSESDMHSIFTDFKPSADNLISQQEFLVFFSKASKTMSNQQFDSMVQEMMS